MTDRSAGAAGEDGREEKLATVIGGRVDAEDAAVEAMESPAANAVIDGARAEAGAGELSKRDQAALP